MKQLFPRRRMAALACGLSLLLSGCGGNGDYTTVHPDTGPIESLVSATGSVAYRDPWSLIPEVNGKIVSCSIEEGDTVTAGEELYVIDSTDLEDQITQAALSLDSAREALRQAEDACGDLTVRAPAGGIITSVLVNVGDFVSAGTPVAQLEDSANLTLTVPFSTADAAAISPGDSAVITFAAYSGQVSAVVERVYQSSVPLSGGREGVYVQLRFTNPGALTAGTVAMASVGSRTCMDSGAVAYKTAQSVYAAQSGQVLTIPVEEGDRVTKDQAILTLDNASLTNAAASAAISLESAQVSLSQLEAKREDYRILAPVDGLILTRSAKEGDYAAAATPLATLVSPDSMCVNVDIDEIYIDQIQAGQEASFTFTTDSGEERTYSAEVRRVDEAGTTSGGVTDYTVELTPENTEGLKSGMNVNVTIITASKAECLRLPSSAVSGNTVQVLRGGKAETVTVVTGISGGGYIEILEGLTEEDQVILP